VDDEDVHGLIIYEFEGRVLGSFFENLPLTLHRAGHIIDQLDAKLTTLYSKRLRKNSHALAFVCLWAGRLHAKYRKRLAPLPPM
jgi:hypothetical protein